MAMEAKGIWLRNKLENHHASQEFKWLMEDIKYDVYKDSTIF
jgi:hypothetical protein